MCERENVDFIVRNYININIIGPNNNKIKSLKGGECQKEFTVEYQNNKYVFNRMHDDENRLVLYSYDGNFDDCVTLVLNKEMKTI
jgi:hypothetical protein